MIRIDRTHRLCMFALIAVVGVTLTSISAQQPQPVTPQTQPTTRPVSELAPLPDVVATVGEETISGPEVNEILGAVPENVPAAALRRVQHRVIDQMIMKQLFDAYLGNQDVTYTEDDLAAVRKELEQAAARQGLTYQQWMEQTGTTEAKLQQAAKAHHLFEQAASEKKVRQFIEKHPAAFDGTKVAASHILIRVTPTASSSKQKQAVKTLEQLAEEIQAGKVDFEKAAKEHSDCPSSTKGGSLGEFTYDKMVPTFSLAAFETPTGEITGPIRTNFGFHLIKVTGRSEGEKEVSGEMKKKLAERTLIAELENRVLDQALTTVPIKMHLDPPAGP